LGIRVLSIFSFQLKLLFTTWNGSLNSLPFEEKGSKKGLREQKTLK
jgi:hypothetical protein